MYRLWSNGFGDDYSHIMPLYSYACMTCDLDYEKERSINDPESKYFCEQCGYALIRTYTPVTAVFKGGGFYKTDNR
jgi:putative FmdB family regulatory protein